MQSSNRVKEDLTLASRYLAGELSVDETATYEKQFLEDPQAVRELEATARMMVGLANLRDSRQLEAVVRSGPSAQGRYVAVAIAASLVMAVLGIFLWRGAFAPERSLLVASSAALRNPSGEPLVVGARYALMRTRGSDLDAVLNLPLLPQAIELRVRPELLAESYRATLASLGEDGSIRQVAVIDGLRVDNDRFVRMYLDSSKLSAGPYLLILSAADGQRGDPPTSAFRLKVTQE